jgi:Holliday junction DNA helicase RuvA
MRLYGFATADERRVFLELTRVSGIGPRAALKMLSATSPGELIRMLEAEDVDGLVRLPGLGRKTAQKVILTLRGTLVAEEGEATPAHAELVEALVEMGFDRSRVAGVVNALSAELVVSPDVDGTDLEKEIFRLAIVRLSGE